MAFCYNGYRKEAVQMSKNETKEKHNTKDELLRKGNATLHEFKDFISRGNVIDMAVGVIIGGAFGKIVTSVVNDMLMPLIGVIIGGIDFSGLKVIIGGAEIAYGTFIQNVIDFLIVAACIFVFVKIIGSFNKKKEEEAPAEPVVDEKTELLKEIRNLLKERENERRRNRK